jgi:hypothetical protein
VASSKCSHGARNNNEKNDTDALFFSFLFLRYSFNFLRKKALVLIFGPKMSFRTNECNS